MKRFDLLKKRAVVQDWKKSSASTEKPVKKGTPKKASKTSAQKKSSQKSRSMTTTYGNETTIETRTESIPAKYAVVELHSLIPSHDPVSWSPNRLYPAECQQRDYTHDKSEQAKVERGAQNFDSKFLLTDTPSAVDGPPIVATNRIVLGGNARTMMSLLASEDGWGTYQAELQARLQLYGLKDIEQFKTPFLVRIVEVDMASCAKYSNILNRGLTQDIDISTETISFARQLSPAHLEELGELFEVEDAGTMAEALRSPRFQARVIRIFRMASIVTNQNQSQWLDPATGNLSDLGKLLVEKVLLGAILRDKKLIDAARSYTNKIVRALPLLVRMQRLPAEWDLTSDIEEAIRLEAKRRASEMKKNDMLSQSEAFESRISERTETVWEILDQSPRKFKEFLERYVEQAERETRLQQGSNFGFSETMTPDEVIERLQSGNGLADASETAPGNGLVTLREITKQHYDYLPLSSRFGNFFGEIPSNFKVAIFGPDGSGKSTLALEFADELSQLRDKSTGERWNVLYAAIEESTKSAGFQKRAMISNADSRRVFIYDNPTIEMIEEQLSSGVFQAVVIDSVSVLTNDNRTMIQAAKRHPNILWVFTAHAVKSGDKPKGFSDLYHFVDARVFIKNGVATTRGTKNRYGAPADLNVFTR